MPIDVHVLCRNLDPTKTILVFGSGSSTPSGGPTSQQLIDAIFEHFKIPCDPSLTLAELSTIIEKRFGRRDLIDFVKSKLEHLTPKGGIINIPLYNWSGIYTTNYDCLIEKSYSRIKQKLNVYSSNFDFDGGGNIYEQSLYKLHGTIDRDVCYGYNSRMILTVSDYDETSKYRDLLYDKFQEQLGSRTAIIIGHSLADPDLKIFIEESIRKKRNYGAPGKIVLFIYEFNENQSVIYEGRGFDVCFGGIDEFFSELAKQSPQEQLFLSITSDPLDTSPEVNPSVIDVATAKAEDIANLNLMFNGRSASYGDIARGFTFSRDCVDRIETQFAGEGKGVAYVLGAAGVGKTTAIRQALCRLVDRGIRCIEHKSDFSLSVDGWIKINSELKKRKEKIILFIDDAHDHLREINRILEGIYDNGEICLKIVLSSSKPHWNPRLKTSIIFDHGEEYNLSTLSDFEINSLLDLVDAKKEISALVEPQFLGFGRSERYRRLRDRCSADMFVCMKNIFGFQSIDNIILQEFASLSDDYQEVYRNIAAMESAGVRVHRQLVIRSVGIEAENVSTVLRDLEGIIEEYTVSEKEGIYGWCIRHQVIAKIIAKYKYSIQEEFFNLLSKLIDKMNPTYRIEVKSFNDMCDMETGIGRIYDKKLQNVLLRKMISLAPKQNVPRHRLITNLIDQGNYEAAESEIRIFERECGMDGPVYRYKIKLKLAIAKNTSGIMDIDRASMALDAASLAIHGVIKFADDKNMYRVYLETGFDYYKYSGKTDVFEDAISKARDAQGKIKDPDLRRTISLYERMANRSGIGIV